MLLVVISSVTTLLLLRGLETAPFLFIFCFLSLPLFLRLVSLAILEEEVEDDKDVGYGVDHGMVLIFLQMLLVVAIGP